MKKQDGYYQIYQTPLNFEKELERVENERIEKENLVRYIILQLFKPFVEPVKDFVLLFKAPLS